MARLLRVVLVVAAVAGAFAGGYLLKNPPSFAWAAADSAPAADVGKPPEVAVAQTTVLARRTVAMTTTAPATGTRLVHARTEARTVAKQPDVALPPMPAPRAEPSTIILPPIGVAEGPRFEPVDPNDPALRMIRDAMGIKTTVLDRSAPPPIILTDAKRDSEPAVIAPPIPMAGPPPKLDLPPEIRIGPLKVPPLPKPVPLLNNRAVELDFEVTRAGLSKIKAVELWTTRDGGATWTRTDRMEGAMPPFRTRLGSEGEYGFRLVFESEAGMRTPDPKPGQAPDLRMVLDTTPPQIRIHPPTPIPGQPGRIVLNWNVQDTHPDRDPGALRLEYSADGQTWQLIERRGAGPGQSSHDWSLPPGVPPRVLLRVIARDSAGNVATAVTNEKMSVDLLAPEGKLTGVRPQGQAPERGPMPRPVSSPGVTGLPSPAGAGLRVALFNPAALPTNEPRRLIDLLTDRDWTPSSATPDSYRTWDVPIFGARPFDGKCDTGPGYWGSFPGVALRLDF